MVCDPVILAAGLGTRMVSSTPKALHRLGGVPLVGWAEQACRLAAGRAPTIVVGPEAAESMQAVLPADVRLVEQVERRGTGHALRQAEPLLRGAGDLVLVATADMPLVRAETLRQLIERQSDNPGPMTLAHVRSRDARGFGRVIRRDGRVAGVVEQAEATPDQLAIDELNTSLYCFAAAWLWENLPRLKESAKGEIYLTDLVGLAALDGEVAAVEVGDLDEVIGINDRRHLAEAETALRRRINRAWMESGVTLADPENTYIGPTVRLEPDVEILPNTHLWGATVVGRGSVVGPNTILRDTTVGESCRIEASVLEGAELDSEVHVGPFAHLRPGARLGRGVHMGNFGEVKNSVLGPGVKMGHFSYVGDAELGAGTNVGAGTITCNFDRSGKKNRSVVGERVFLGSDTLLVAPLRIGDDSATGAGSVVTRDLPPHSLAVGMPARVVRKLNEDDG